MWWGKIPSNISKSSLLRMNPTHTKKSKDTGVLSCRQSKCETSVAFSTLALCVNSLAWTLADLFLGLSTFSGAVCRIVNACQSPPLQQSKPQFIVLVALSKFDCRFYLFPFLFLFLSSKFSLSTVNPFFSVMPFYHITLCLVRISTV